MTDNRTDEDLLIQALQEAAVEENAEGGYSGATGLDIEHVKDGFYKFLRELKSTEDSTKIANLTSDELGKSELSLRGAQKLALLCDTLGMSSLGTLYRQEGEILAASSMSRYVKGVNFLNLIFTQIKKSISAVEPQEVQKKGWFGNKSG